MIRLTLRIVIGCLIAIAIWWVGPLVTIGIYKPLGGVLLRQVLVAVVLLWALWPLLARLWMRMSMSTWRTRSPPKTASKSHDPLSRRLRDLDGYLRQLWLKNLWLRNRAGWRTAWKVRRKAPHLGMYPWFAVIGASGCGKTTMIRRGGVALKGNSDLLGGDGTEEGHTVDCNFWLAGDAIWFDINGEWIEPGSGSSSADLTEWTSWLTGLKKTKRMPALDGVILCVDCDWLGRASAENRKRAADALRARISEMSEILSLKLPIYLALTGLDKIPGATALLSGLDDDVLEQGIGFGFPVSIDKSDENVIHAYLDERMRLLERSLQERVLLLASSVAEPALNADRLRFIENLSRFQRYLSDYLNRSILEASVSQACHLRGVWFGSSVDLLKDATPSMLDADGSEIAEYGARRLSTLWGAVLRQMKQEQGLATMSGSTTGRKRFWNVTRWVLPIGAVAIGVAIVMFGYLLENGNIERVYARFTEAKRLAELESADSKPSTALIDVMAQMRYIEYNVQSASELLVTPYWEHARISAVAHETYRKHLRKMLLPELYNYVGESLTSQVQGAPGDTYETLKIYLMLAHPEHRNADDLIRWMNTQWPQLAKDGYSDEERQEYEGHLRALFTLKGMPATPEDAELVQEARVKAAQIPSVTRVINRIESAGLPSQIEDVSLAKAGGFMAATTLRMRGELSPTDSAIPGWYTRAGYQDVFKPKLESASRAILEEESWVLRDEPLSGNTFEIDKAVEKLADATRSQFLQEYIERWQAFLKDITVRRYSSMDDAAQLASSFIDPQSPLAQLVRFAGRETTLTGNYEGDVDSWIDKQKFNIERDRRAIVGELSGDRARFKLMPEHVVDDYFQAIRRLGTQLTQASTSGNGNGPLSRLFEPVYRQLSLVNGAMISGQVMPGYDAFARLRAQAATQPEPLRGIVLDLVDSGSSADISGSRAIINQDAAGAAHPFCNQGLATRYPLNRSAQEDVGVQDFERLFGPQGVMASYFKEHLASYVDTSTSPWRAKRPDGNRGLVNPDVLRAYEAASRIGAAMLDDQGNLRVSTMVRVIDMDPQIGEIQIDFGSASIRYAHGSVANKRIDWTSHGVDGQLYIRVSVKTVDGRSNVKQFDGPWALFRFFDAGRAEGSEASRRETVYQTMLGSVRLEWQALTTPAPLWSNLLQSFSCPK
jgi:type VI secretion system protein ImpL